MAWQMQVPKETTPHVNYEVAHFFFITFDDLIFISLFRTLHQLKNAIAKVGMLKILVRIKLKTIRIETLSTKTYLRIPFNIWLVNFEYNFNFSNIRNFKVNTWYNLYIKKIF